MAAWLFVIVGVLLMVAYERDKRSRYKKQDEIAERLFKLSEEVMASCMSNASNDIRLSHAMKVVDKLTEIYKDIRLL